MANSSSLGSPKTQEDPKELAPLFIAVGLASIILSIYLLVADALYSLGGRSSLIEYYCHDRGGQI
jgi:hypothetical protein